MKRKYTRKVSPEIIQAKSSPVKGSSNTISPVGVETTTSTVKMDKNVQSSYTALPITLRNEIEHIIEYRKLHGYFDDSVERKERAVRYWKSH